VVRQLYDESPNLPFYRVDLRSICKPVRRDQRNDRCAAVFGWHVAHKMRPTTAASATGRTTPMSEFQKQPVDEDADDLPL
jgi:hypothetical protein